MKKIDTLPNYQPLSKINHAGKGWTPYANYNFAAGDALAPLVSQEFFKAVLALPIAFTLQGEELAPVAVMGLASGKNLCVSSDGRWLAGYVPAVYRSYPFALATTDDDQQVLCVDENSGLLGTGGEAFFNEDGSPSPKVTQVLDFLTQVNANRAVTRRSCQALQMHKLVKPWPVKLKTESGETMVEGLHCIDETALNALPPDALLELRNTGALALAYCQLLSMQNLQLLGQFAQRSAAMAVAQPLPTPPENSLNFQLSGSNDLDFSNLS